MTSASADSESLRAPASRRPILVVEDDWFTRMIGLILDPTTSEERRAAFADFFAHDEPDFPGYCARVRARVPCLFPAEVRLADDATDLHTKLPGARVLIVESLPVGRTELEAGRELAVVQKFGFAARNIDTRACAERGIRVLTIRRRSSMTCAEHTIALMLTLARKLNRLVGRISPEQLAGEGGSYRPFDRRHTANANWARVPGLRTLHGSSFGIIGVGEIGREIVLRLRPFEMRLLYHQRSRLPEEEERELGIRYAPLNTLLAESDWVVPQVPGGMQTKGFVDAARLAQMKPGAMLVNISRADVVDRAALIEALRSGHLGGFALDPLYESPGRSDDELLGFRNVVLTPHIAAQPRSNVLDDMSDMIAGLAQALAE